MLLILLAACPVETEKPSENADSSSDSGDGSFDSGDSGGDTAADTASTDDGCPDDIGAITVSGDPVPGSTLTVSLSSDAPAVAWTVMDEDGATVGPVTDGTFAIPADRALYEAETLTVHADACDQTADLDVVVDWPEAARVVVIYNPAVEGSEDVAQAYADFREVPAENLCAVASTTSDTLAGAEYPAFVDAVFACAPAHSLYLVPVYGVPYKVGDRINEWVSGVPTVVSLDALLFAGPDSVNLTDSEYNPLYRNGDSTDQDYRDYRSAGKNRNQGDYWLVTRIDGADADAAIELIERTRLAEEAVAAGTLSGIVYVDGNRGDVEPDPAAGFGSYEWGEWNMWGTRHVFEALGEYEVVWDGNSEEFGTAPAPETCPDALYYAGWYSYYNYNDCFDWTVGAIGGHLDSCSACDIRNPGTWSGSALLDGITATFGAVNEPYVSGMPEYDQFFYYLLQGANYGEAAYESTVVGYWMMVWVGDPLYRPYGANPRF